MLVKVTVVGQPLPQEAYDLRLPDKKGVAFRCVDRLRQGHEISRERLRGKMTVVEREMERCGLAVMGIAEYWWLGQGRFSTAEGITIMYSGKKKCRCGIYGQQLDIKGGPGIQPSE